VVDDRTPTRYNLRAMHMATTSIRIIGRVSRAQVLGALVLPAFIVGLLLIL
jgi:hypothetical protein